MTPKFCARFLTSSVLALALATAPAAAAARAHSAPAVATASAHPTVPTAASFSQTVPANRESAVQLQGADAEATALTYAVASGPSHGALSGLNASTGAVVYTPAPGYTGADSFTYTVTSGGETSSAGTVTLAVSNAKTRIIDTVADGSGAPRQGKVTFILTQPVTTPAGLTPAGASVSASLNGAGQFDISVYPSKSLSPNAYYQVWFEDRSTLKREMLGLYEIPLSTATVTLAAYKVTDTNLAARYTFASEAAVSALTSAAATATAVTLLGTSPVNNTVPKYDAGTNKYTGSAITDNGSTVAVGRDTSITGALAVSGAATTGSITSSGTVTASNYVGITNAALPATISSKFFTGATLQAPLIITPTISGALSVSSLTSSGTITAANLVGNCSGCTGIAIGESTGNSAAASLSSVFDSDNNGSGIYDIIKGSSTVTRWQNDGSVLFTNPYSKFTSSAGQEFIQFNGAYPSWGAAQYPAKAGLIVEHGDINAPVFNAVFRVSQGSTIATAMPPPYDETLGNYRVALFAEGIAKTAETGDATVYALNIVGERQPGKLNAIFVAEMDINNNNAAVAATTTDPRQLNVLTIASGGLYNVQHGIKIFNTQASNKFIRGVLIKDSFSHQGIAIGDFWETSDVAVKVGISNLNNGAGTENIVGFRSTDAGVDGNFINLHGSPAGSIRSLFTVKNSGNLVMKKHIEFHRDDTPTKAMGLGMSVPGAAAGDNFIISSYDGAAWAERFRVRPDGNLRLNNAADISTGAGAPGGVCSAGIYLRTDVTAGVPGLYVCLNGTWTANN